MPGGAKYFLLAKASDACPELRGSVKTMVTI